MINILDLSNKHRWLPQLKNVLHRYEDLLDMPIELIEYRILRNELFCFDVNEEIYVVGNVFPYGTQRVFFVYFLAGSNLRKNIGEMITCVKDQLGCDCIDFHYTGAGRERLYRQLFQNEETQYRKYCKVKL